MTVNEYHLGSHLTEMYVNEGSAVATYTLREAWSNNVVKATP
jgi:hypothetical protein